MTLEHYLSFITYALAVTILPGPNNVLLLSQASRVGIKGCIRLLLGIWTGLITVMLLSGTFLSFLDSILPRFTPFFRWIGAGYILYLAYKTLRRPPLDTEGTTDADTGCLRFRDGFLLQFLNVKVLLLGLAAFPGYFLGNHITWIRPVTVLIFTISMTACCGTGNLIWMLAGGILRPVYNRFYRAVNIIMALLLVWCAVMILL